jgi:predicted TIM-barrel fold metal-dependent hydrolase
MYASASGNERIAPFFDKAAELGVPLMFHTADPGAFFLPIDSANERYEELAAHPDWSFFGSQHSKRELLDHWITGSLDQLDRVCSRHPDTTFVAEHVAEGRRPGPHRIDA